MQKLFGKYQQLSNLRDENIRLGNTELDTETLHGLQEAYLINHMNWLKSFQKTYKKQRSYRSAIIKKIIILLNSKPLLKYFYYYSKLFRILNLSLSVHPILNYFS
jgi:hypothetical protein